MPPMKYREIVAGKLTAAGVSWGLCSVVTKMADDGWSMLTPAMDAAILSILTNW